MSYTLEVTESEKELLERLRALPPRLRKQLTHGILSADEANPVQRADPEAAKQFGLPGAPPVWRMDPDERREMNEFLKACERVSLDG